MTSNEKATQVPCADPKLTDGYEVDAWRFLAAGNGRRADVHVSEKRSVSGEVNRLACVLLSGHQRDIKVK